MGSEVAWIEKKKRDGKAFPEPTIGLCIPSCMFTKGTYQYSLLNAAELQTIYSNL
jgi:hypothetical protein